MKHLLIATIAIFTMYSSYGQGQPEATPKYQDVTLDFETRAADLVSRMTLEEKISQLVNKSPAIPRLGINAYEWWNECLHGVARAGTATMFPQATGMAATFDKSMMLDVATVISDEARAKHHFALQNNDFSRYKGLTFWSPNINIYRDPRWGRGHETYGEDPYLTGQMGIQFVKGLQGDDSKYLKLVATAKHFAVHNGPEPERHTFNAVPNARDLWETYLPAFEDLVVDAKVYSIMGAYNRVDGESASASWMLLEDILRNKWDFDGYVVSDCGAIRDIYKYHKIVNTPEEAAAVGVRRGCDLNCGSVYNNHLQEAVDLGLIDEGEIDLSVYRLMLARMKLGMFDQPEMVPYASISYEVNDSKPHDEMALAMAQKSMTLLKNDGILPLNKSKISSIAVVGPNADNLEALRGNYFGTATHPITVINGIRKAAGADVDITYSKGVPLVIDEVVNHNYTVIDGQYLSTLDKNGQSVQGLTGYYYNNMELKGEPVVEKIDPQIKFNYGVLSPTATDVAQGILSPEMAIPDDKFSIRWTGQLKASQTGKHLLGVASDDGCRLYVDGKLIADGWFNHGMKPFLGEVDLENGKSYDIKVEYFENTGDAEVNLVWVLPENNTEEENENPMELSAQTLAEVKQADVAIFVGGLDATWEGEEMGGRSNIDGFNRGDRTKIELPEVQLKALKAMKATGTPVVLVLMAGGAVSFDGLEEELDGILMAWYPGQRGGDAVADVLFGEYNPAGRLPVTFYSSTDELADFRDYNMRAGKGFTYRYYTGEALYPFGHGLSYTSFKYSDLQLDKTTVDATGELSVSVKVKNTGKWDGEEVIQVYLKDLESDQWMAIKQLRKFERISLKKGESKTVTFELNVSEDFRYYDAALRQYVVEPGAFEIQMGASSQDIRLKKTVTVKD
ncbi:MAG: glycoside hydrolase family 3 C-terminal domain-containing protein [Reichenbachiella sp.]|uniref:glycoside hydrolase family 3 C-terminal domain-containing protein n=1 Tax=Reichenbachiella sp. TaxID=2184521 RepID=UPI0032979B11